MELLNYVASAISSWFTNFNYILIPDNLTYSFSDEKPLSKPPTLDLIIKNNRVNAFKMFNNFDLKHFNTVNHSTLVDSKLHNLEDKTQIHMPNTIDFDTCKLLFGPTKINNFYFQPPQIILENVSVNFLHFKLFPLVEPEVLFSIFYLYKVSPVLLIPSLLFSSYWLCKQRLCLIECALHVHFSYLQTLKSNMNLLNDTKYLLFDKLSKPRLVFNYGETPLLRNLKIQHELDNYIELSNMFKSFHLPLINHIHINSMSNSFLYDNWSNHNYRFDKGTVDIVFNLCTNYVSWTNDFLLMQHQHMYVNFVCNSYKFTQITDILNLYTNFFTLCP